MRHRFRRGGFTSGKSGGGKPRSRSDRRPGSNIVYYMRNKINSWSDDDFPAFEKIRALEKFSDGKKHTFFLNTLVTLHVILLQCARHLGRVYPVRQ